MSYRMKQGKCLGHFAPEEIITRYIYSLMKEKKDFMVFPDGKQILIEEEVDEWNKVHGLMNETERIMYHCVNDGYAIHYNEYLYTLLIPFSEIMKDYDSFMSQLKEELYPEEEI